MEFRKGLYKAPLNRANLNEWFAFRSAAREDLLPIHLGGKWGHGPPEILKYTICLSPVTESFDVEFSKNYFTYKKDFSV